MAGREKLEREPYSDLNLLAQEVHDWWRENYGGRVVMTPLPDCHAITLQAIMCATLRRKSCWILEGRWNLGMFGTRPCSNGPLSMQVPRGNERHPT